MKIRPKSSTFASGAPQRVVLSGGKKGLDKKEMAQELQSLMQVIAAIVEENGQVVVDKDTIHTVAKEGRTLKLYDDGVTLSITFDVKDSEQEVKQEEEQNDNVDNPAREERFFESDAAREAREYLRRSRESDTSVDTGSTES